MKGKILQDIEDLSKLLKDSNEGSMFAKPNIMKTNKSAKKEIAVKKSVLSVLQKAREMRKTID